MFIILSITSKNLNSLTNFLKFVYKLNENKPLKKIISITQVQKKKKKNRFSVLQSPHVNKKSQEQFKYCLYNKQLKMNVNQFTKFLVAWKKIDELLFLDIKVKTKVWISHKKFNSFVLNAVNFKTIAKNFSNMTKSTRLKLLDINGEILIKKIIKSLDSSAGRAKDWKSLCRQFKSVSGHNKFFLW